MTGCRCATEAGIAGVVNRGGKSGSDPADLVSSLIQSPRLSFSAGGAAATEFNPSIAWATALKRGKPAVVVEELMARGLDVVWTRPALRGILTHRA